MSYKQGSRRQKLGQEKEDCFSIQRKAFVKGVQRTNVRACKTSLERLVAQTLQGLLRACMCVKVTQSCPPPCDPVNCCPPGSSVCGIL